MLLRREMVTSLGGFDPRFFLYFEETDLCLRAARRGWQIWTVGEAVGRHVNAAVARSVSKRMMWGAIPEHYFRSRFYYMTKNFGRGLAVLAEIGEIACMILRAAVDKVRGRTYSDLTGRLQSPVLRMPRPLAVGRTEQRMKGSEQPPSLRRDATRPSYRSGLNPSRCG
jgi:GT2 family glycosyltransferase